MSSRRKRSNDGSWNNIVFFVFYRLIEIITIAIKCLLVFSPKLLNLLNDAEFTPGQWQPLVEIEFTAPKLNIGPHYSQLTFGTLLRAASFFAKTLQVVCCYQPNSIIKE